ncbi:hypothetical protein AC578_10038 [Pseudocercospora eumusae]|uniref:Uncharacterized protein n=1 Tax=Pseudocercospora eumusae TaxID=321146 RepID=A0A139H845_9PEZI|nr:hypothetical protein AC578_10038 [Pseudocercospora eumusae]
MIPIPKLRCYFCISSDLREDDHNHEPIARAANDHVYRHQNTSSAAVPTTSPSRRGSPRDMTGTGSSTTLVSNESIIVPFANFYIGPTAGPSRLRRLPLGEELENIYDRMTGVSSLGPSWLEDKDYSAMVRVSQKLPSEPFSTWFARLQFRYTLEHLSYHTDDQLDFDRVAFRGWLDSFYTNLAHIDHLEIEIPEASIANARAETIHPSFHNSNPHHNKYHYVHLLRITVIKKRYRIHYCSRGADDHDCQSCSTEQRWRWCWWKASEILRLLISAFGRVGVTLLSLDQPRHVNWFNAEERFNLERLEHRSGITDAKKAERRGYTV